MSGDELRQLADELMDLANKLATDLEGHRTKTWWAVGRLQGLAIGLTFTAPDAKEPTP